MEILNLMEETNFYGNLDILLHSLFTLNVNRNTKCKFTEGMAQFYDLKALRLASDPFKHIV